MKQSGRSNLLEKIISETIPMRGRMIHGKNPSGTLYEQGQDYDIHGRVRFSPSFPCHTYSTIQTLFAADRGGLNKILLDELESLPNVKFFFNHKLTGADFRKQKAWFEVTEQKSSARGRNKEIEINFDLLIGADGAHSSTRYHMMKYVRMDYQQEYIDTLWCEFQITARDIKTKEDEKSKFAISPHHLHIWPGKEFMFIAIPSLVTPPPLFGLM